MFKCGNVTVCGKAVKNDSVTPIQADQMSGLGGTLLGAQPEGKKNAKTLVIALEALIFNTLQPLEDADFIINVEVDEIVYQVHVKKRPGIEEFLAAAAENFEVIIWTSRAQYVNSCIDQIDTNKVVSARLFREHCKRDGEDVIKDLNSLGRPLKKTILIDDSPKSYLNLPRNSIPMHPWQGNNDDNELTNLIPLLTQLAKAADVRKILDASVFSE